MVVNISACSGTSTKLHCQGGAGGGRDIAIKAASVCRLVLCAIVQALERRLSTLFVPVRWGNAFRLVRRG